MRNGVKVSGSIAQGAEWLPCSEVTGKHPRDLLHLKQRYQIIEFPIGPGRFRLCAISRATWQWLCMVHKPPGQGVHKHPDIILPDHSCANQFFACDKSCDNQRITSGIVAAECALARGNMAAMQALSKPFAGQKIECRSARQSQRVTASAVVRASQEEQTLVRSRQTTALIAAPQFRRPSCAGLSFPGKGATLYAEDDAMFHIDGRKVEGRCMLPTQARRGVLGGIIGAAALLSSPRDASAAFGDAARVRMRSLLQSCPIRYLCCEAKRDRRVLYIVEKCLHVQVFGSKPTNTSG